MKVYIVMMYAHNNGKYAEDFSTDWNLLGAYGSIEDAYKACVEYDPKEEPYPWGVNDSSFDNLERYVLKTKVDETCVVRGGKCNWNLVKDAIVKFTYGDGHDVDDWTDRLYIFEFGLA